MKESYLRTGDKARWMKAARLTAVFMLFFMSAIFLSFPPLTHSGEVTLSWQANSESDIGGYRVYYGMVSRQYTQTIGVGKKTAVTIKNLDPGRPYYFVVSAYDLSAYESPFSAETVKVADGSPAPAPQYSLTVTQSGPASGTITGPGISCGTDCNESYPAGTAVTLTATPNTGALFAGWGGACTGTGACTINLTADKTVQALFNSQPLPPPVYQITATANPGGTITPPGTVSVNGGGSQSYTVAPKSGYRVSEVKADGVSKGAVSSYTFANVTTHHTIEAIFGTEIVNPYTLNLTTAGDGNGSVYVTPVGLRYPAGTVVTLTATPSASSAFAGWSGAITGSALSSTVTMRSNLSVTANFKTRINTVTAIAGAGGSISPKGPVNVSNGGSQTFAITPAVGSSIKDVKVDGVSLGPVPSYTLSNVTANHTIEAVFDEPPAEERRTVLALNCGGRAYKGKSGIHYQADAYFSGGQTYSVAAGIEGTEDGAVYQSERFGNFSYNLPLENGEYLLTLQFAEIYPYALQAGTRVFNVFVEGTPVLTNLDLFARVGGNRAYNVPVPVRVTDGLLKIDFQSVADSAKVNGIVISQGGPGEEPQDGPPEVVAAINCGGPQYVDEAGIVYQADMHFVGGQTYKTNSPIQGTADSPLYQSERFGNFYYSIPLSDGNYQVTLKLAEIYDPSPGTRVFGVKIGGQEVVTHLDLFKQVGRLQAYDVTVPVTVTDGALEIDFEGTVGNAKVSAIVVTRNSSSAPVAPTSPQVVWAVNCGGPGTVDKAGIVYQADSRFTGGGSYATSQPIDRTEDDLLYQSERFGNFSYNIPLANGTYKVILKFAEIYYSGPGQRIFTVKMDGRERVRNLDIAAQVGRYKAYDIQISAQVTRGLLNIEFVTVKNNAKVSAIRIEKQ